MTSEWLTGQACIGICLFLYLWVRLIPPRSIAVSRSVDIWSCGITFVELVTGCPPYYDTSPEGLNRLADPEQGFVPPGLPDVSMANSPPPPS